MNEAPRFASGVVGTVRVGKVAFVVFHWNEPTSTEAAEGNGGDRWVGEQVEPTGPKAVKSAFTITSAPAMMRPLTIESLLASVSLRRMAKPPPTAQMVPKINPMSMTMPIALLGPSAKMPAAWASIDAKRMETRNCGMFMRFFVNHPPKGPAPPVEPLFKARMMESPGDEFD